MAFNKKITLFGENLIITPLVLLVALAVILRIPSLFEPYWYGDEGIYLTLGEGVRQGLVLYRDIFDHKPPAIYLVSALAGSLFWFKFILLVWHAATVVLFWKLARILFDKKDKAVILASSIFTILTTIPLLEGNIANSELFMAGPTIAAFLLVFSVKTPTVKRIFLAGILFSLAVSFKVPAIWDMAALLAFWGITSLWKWKKILKVVGHSFVLLSGFLLPILAMGAYYWLRGAFPEFLEATFAQNLTYIAQWGGPGVTGGIENQLQQGLLFRGQVLGILLVGIIALKKFFDKNTLLASVWTIFAIFAMLLSGRPYPHYIIQAIVPLSLLVAILITGRERYRFLTVPFLLIFFASLVFYKFYYFPIFSYYQNFLSFATGQKNQEEYFRSFDHRVPKTYKLADIITSKTSPQDKIFIWGTEPELYALARRVPPGRYVTSFHISGFDGRGETLKDLQENPPKYIILIQDESRPFPELKPFLQKNYLYLETIDNAEIWKLVNPGLLRSLLL